MQTRKTTPSPLSKAVPRFATVARPPWSRSVGGDSVGGGGDTSSAVQSPATPVLPIPDLRAFRSAPRGFRSAQLPPITPSKRVRTPNYSRVPGFADTIRSPVVNVISPATDSPPVVEAAPGAARTTDVPTPVAVDPSKDYLDAHFETERPLDRGSFSDVYLVRSRVDGSVSAVKRIREQYRGAKDREAKLREVQNFQRLGPHPHLVRLLEAWEQRGHLYMRTEFCSRGSLRRLLDEMLRTNQRMDDAVVRDILVDILLGLQFMHSRRVVHFDLKPANLLLGDDGRIKIADLGIAVHVDEAAPPRDPVEGDKVYMAPELLSDKASPAIDIFSLGLIIVEMSAMWLLPTESSQWQQLREGDFSELPLDVMPTDLADLAVSMLARDPTRRPTVDVLLRHPAVAPVVQARARAEPSRWSSFLSALVAAVKDFFAPPPTPELPAPRPVDGDVSEYPSFSAYYGFSDPPDSDDATLYEFSGSSDNLSFSEADTDLLENDERDRKRLAAARPGPTSSLAHLTESDQPLPLQQADTISDALGSFSLRRIGAGAAGAAYVLAPNLSPIEHLKPASLQGGGRPLGANSTVAGSVDSWHDDDIDTASDDAPCVPTTSEGDTGDASAAVAAAAAAADASLRDHRRNLFSNFADQQ